MKHITVELTEDQYATIMDFVYDERTRLEDLFTPERLAKTENFGFTFKDVTASNERKLAYMKRLETELHKARSNYPFNGLADLKYPIKISIKEVTKNKRG
jgi:hypothetical protein